ncbi:uncharacterized protein LOC6551226 [Drosophila erecta]|uniref:uncharacterized protein LOC6551226 n=1 Tax=Drosophila erecta TaxID=7220 RepID=UPI000F05777E|nr:uncharacterized protein LOC6551226 [Drosophila erecta]
MSSSFKSRIPERVMHSLTVLDGPHMRVSRVRDVARHNRCSLNRSQLPLPISSTLSSLVKQVPPKVACKKPETETESVIRSLLRRSRPPAVRGNRTSFRRIQLAHGSPVASASLVMKSISCCCSTKNRLQIPINASSPAAPEEDRDHSADNLTSAKSLLELVAGKRQPAMEQMRFLCNDHCLINVPSPLMYHHSGVMSRLEGEEQPIELRSIRSVTLLRVIMWMHQKTLSGNGAVAPPTVEEMAICANRESNGGTKSENSFQLSENTHDNGQNMVNSICQVHGEKIEHNCTKPFSNAHSVNYQLGKDCASIRYEDTENSRENNGNPYQSGESLGENARNSCFQTSDTKKCFENNEQSPENYKVDFATEMKCSGYKQSINEKTENCTVTKDNVEEGEKIILDNSNIQLHENNGSTESINVKKDTSDEFPNVNGNSQDYSVISEKNTEISNEISTGIKIGEEGQHIESESSCLISDNRDNVMQKFSDVKESNENRRYAGDNANGDQCVKNLNRMKHSAFLLGSWEERLLGSELYQLVELILAAHYLGIESLTLNAIHHFGELMAQRTRSEACLMLRIRKRLAGERQTLENHRPLIRETLPQGHHRKYQADRAEIRKQHFDPNSSTARMGRQRRSNRRLAGEGGEGEEGEEGGEGMEGRPYAIEPRRRHHQYCFQSRI